MMTKKDCRVYARSLLEALPAETRLDGSRRLVRCLSEFPLWIHAATVYLFCPMDSEPDISPLATSALESGKAVGVAVISPGGLFFRQISSLLGPDWHSNRYGIPEPAKGAILEPPAGDESGNRTVVLVPGLLFTSGGGRLGRGGGYYDRWLSTFGNRCYKIGVGFSCQIVAEIPAETHDIDLDMVCTEQGFVKKALN
jgi:5-formyltetrahydrofolate cyclo-ligase